MLRLLRYTFYALCAVVLVTSCQQQSDARKVVDFNSDWYFYQGSLNGAAAYDHDHSKWKQLDLPHDWSIESSFDPETPAGVGGGALPGGIGWYRKVFTLEDNSVGKKVFIQFDGVYQNSTVWINEHELGTRPNGYISFEYEITPFLFTDKPNVLAVRVDNADQPNSRWYSGSGIYRDVRLVTKGSTYIPQWGVYITTPQVSKNEAQVMLETTVINTFDESKEIKISTEIFSQSGVQVAEQAITKEIASGEEVVAEQSFTITNPELWSVYDGTLYTAKTTLSIEETVYDNHYTRFGIRDFSFSAENGFVLNGEPVKIKGVCLHHDLGALGAAYNRRAMQRQLEIMIGMGVNSIRTSHNPPASDVLALCDEMGLLVMDEMFDMWAQGKTEFDYSKHWEKWHKKDLEDFVKRDRNHPSVIMWSIGNEIIEQYDHDNPAGGEISSELAAIVRSLDDRLITAANNDVSPDNSILKAGNLDIVGFNYNHDAYEKVPQNFPNRPFIATETNSELSTRGYYDMPSDSVRVWPFAWDELFTEGNPDNTVSAYDHVRPPWGSTHEDTWKIVKANDFISGMFIWTGFDYLGEPTPYVWPSRSSYFGVVDLAGFPKDTYYFYQSEWSDDTVLHVFPHWNWEANQMVDVWAYYNHADEVELFLNGKSLGAKSKTDDELHIMWRVPFQPGVIKAVSRKGGEEVLSKEIKTAGEPASIRLLADRSEVNAGVSDLSFITVEILDADGNLVPHADNLVSFSVSGEGFLRAVDNGDPTSHESFQAAERKAFFGKCLAVVQAGDVKGAITVTAESEGLALAKLQLTVKN
jgi:beta-galactosidase